MIAPAPFRAPDAAPPPLPHVALPVATLVLAALALGSTWAHVLELPQKLRLDDAGYAFVNGALYRWFAVVGAPLSMLAIGCAAALAWRTRDDARARGWTAAGAALLALWLASWALVVQPVNAEIAEALRDAPASVPARWAERRARWEGGHVLGFALELAAFVAIAVGVLRRSPERSSAAPRGAARARPSPAPRGAASDAGRDVAGSR